MEKITVQLPRNFMNAGITLQGNFIANTNNSQKWDMLKFPLPKGKWHIFSKNGMTIILVRYTLLPYFRFEWWAKKKSSWFSWYKCNAFTMVTIFKYLHLRITDSKLDYMDLSQAG